MTHKKKLQTPTRAHNLLFWPQKNLTHFMISEIYTPKHISKASCACPN